MKKNNYKCKNTFYLRTPYLTYDFYKNNLAGHDLKNIEELTKKIYAENILSSSRSLYDSLLNDKETKNKKMNLYKYLLRGSIRTTPFGLNSSVLQGKFDGNPCYLIGNNKKKTRPDIEWLCLIIKKIEDELGKNLKVIKSDNNIIIKRNHVLKIVESCFTKSDRALSEKCQINYTKLVKRIFEICDKDYIEIKNLIELLKKDYPGQEEKIYSFILEILDNEFIVSDLRINLLTQNPFKDFLERLNISNYNTDLKEKLIEIDELVDFYNSVDIGCGEKLYLNIIRKMSNIAIAENYLQIDMYNESKVTLEKSIKKELEDFANFIMGWTINETYDEYILKFKEKYGEQAVKLTDVIDEDSGLGIPQVDGKNTTIYREAFLTTFLNYLLKNNTSSIDLSEMANEIDLKNKIEYDYQSTLELSFFILNNNGKYRYILSPMMGSEEKWKSFGRFDYLFSNSLIKEDKEKNNFIKEVELTFYPDISHAANVSISNYNKPAFLEFNTRSINSEKERISIDDIYMFIDRHTKISFLQKSTNQILSFGTTNKYVVSAFPKILKFLVEVSNYQKPSVESFLFLINRLLKNFTGYTPSIKYKNFEILPETWRIDKSKIVINNKFINYSDFDNLITKLIIEGDLPKEIYTGSIDRKLVINLEYDVDRQLLYELLKKDNNLLLYKNEFMSSNLLLINKNNEKYIGEFVFQFESKQVETDLEPYSKQRIPLVTNEDLAYYSYSPFNEWLTLQVYIDQQNENTILINQINEMYNYLTSNNIITNFFFIRYKDPSNHLRLRFKLHDENNSRLLNICTNFINILKEYKILNNAVYSSYVPEINRYGGLNCISLAEDLFHSNSVQVIKLLTLIKHKKIDLNANQLFLIAAYKIILDMNISDEEMVRYIQRYRLDKVHNRLFKLLTDDIKNYYYNCISYEFCKENDVLDLFDILESAKFLNKNYWKNVCKNIRTNNDLDIEIVKRYTINSILHMFHNRLIGINRENEEFLMGSLEKLIYSKIQRDKFCTIK